MDTKQKRSKEHLFAQTKLQADKIVKKLYPKYNDGLWIGCPLNDEKVNLSIYY